MWLASTSVTPLALLLQLSFIVTANPADRNVAYGTQSQQALHQVSYDDDIYFNKTGSLDDLRDTLQVLHTEYFSLWLGKWTEAIDWTGAVINAFVLATLSSLSQSHSYKVPGEVDVEAQILDNEINKYFGQSTAYYFGEDYFAIRMQAFDDMLWVNLGWLESINFITSHSKAHFLPINNGPHQKEWWHGTQFIPPFAHRARVFYELAEKGWDWILCGGGMTWDPNLLVYKNAITNQLFISGSIAMYLHFPGDENCSPFMGMEETHSKLSKMKPREREDTMVCSGETTNESTYDPTYLAAAIDGYEWLANINMTNAQGLYVDGFHIAGYATNHSKTECDERNEMVYTYNQGVILSGLRGLWEATGNVGYLEDGHELVRNVIRATGWTDTDVKIAGEGAFSRKHMPETYHDPRSQTWPEPLDGWSGLGAHGILTELCDPSGSCNQDGQMFKGIFFHHIVAFCTPLPLSPVKRGKTYAASPSLAALHFNSCREYTPWVTHNAKAALKTRDSKGRFGMWWGASDAVNLTAQERAAFDLENMLAEGAIDYKAEPYNTQRQSVKGDGKGDLNDRGRGRTVETQGGGLAVVRAQWEFENKFR